MKKLITYLFILLFIQSFGNSINDGYKALSIFDYFKAKQLFYKSLKKHPAAAAYGLATIYSRTDNPFTDIDSSAKYIALCKFRYTDSVSFSNIQINSTTISNLAHTISLVGYEKYAHNGNINSISHYLTNYFFATDSIKQLCYDKRDALALNQAIGSQMSDSIAFFIKKYPQSSLYQKAQKLFYDFEYNELTSNKTSTQYQYFLKHYPNNPNIVYAEKNLFNIIKEKHSTDSLYLFIKNYSTILTNDEAWKFLYNMSVKTYHPDELQKFLNRFPEYPYSMDLLKEISLSNIRLIPIKNQADKFGFIDSLGNWIIKPLYDDALEFSEGIASVCKNDSCYYINKEGKKLSDHYFEEAESYKNGVAIAKHHSLYYLINRSGQFISEGYQDIVTNYGKYFVCKKNDKYGAINSKGEIIIPFTYSKLGSFENGVAYYMTHQYGLINTNNSVLSAQWDWISGIDANSLAIVKKDKFFGLMNWEEELLLSLKYDFITHCTGSIYLVVQNNLYGFYNASEKCFVTLVNYDFDKTKPTSYYTNGNQFKLVQDEETAIVDVNGRQSIPFGTFKDVYFAKCDIIKVQKKQKYGYVDRKLRSITAIEFDEAEDFKNNTAIVYKKETAYIINTDGKIIYTLKDGDIIDEFGLLIYKTEIDSLSGLITNRGEVLLPIEYNTIEKITSTLFLCYKNNQQFLYNSSLKKLVKL